MKVAMEDDAQRAGTDDLDALARLAEQCRRVFRLSSLHAPAAVFVGAEISARAYGLDGEEPDIISLSGKGLTLEAAYRSCMGEGAETLSSLAWGDEPALEMPLAEGLKDLPAQDRDWVLNQLAPENHHDGVFLRFLPARRIGCDEAVYLPETLCLRRLGKGSSPAQIPVSSSGCAAAPTLRQAVVAGCLELVERDAAALWWYGRRPPGAVDAENLAQATAFVETLRSGAPANRPMRFLDLTTDIAVPAIAAVSSAPDGTAVACGIAARLDLASALKSAALETCQMELAQELVLLKREQEGEPSLNDGDRRILHRMKELNLHNDSLFATEPAGEGPQGFCETVSGDELTACEDRLARCGHSIYSVDLTREQISIPACRVIIPGLQPLPPVCVSQRLTDVCGSSEIAVASLDSRLSLL